MKQPMTENKVEQRSRLRDLWYNKGKEIVSGYDFYNL